MSNRKPWSASAKTRSKVLKIWDRLEREQLEKEEERDGILDMVKGMTSSVEIEKMINEYKAEQGIGVDLGRVDSQAVSFCSTLNSYLFAAKEEEELAKVIPADVESQVKLAKRNSILNAEGMKLPSIEKTIYKVCSSDLENFFAKIYGKQLEYQATTSAKECGNDETHEYGVSDFVDDYYRPGVEKFLFGDKKYAPTYSMGTILNIMCESGFIPEGSYLVTISY